MVGIIAALISFTVFVLVHAAICHWTRWRPLSRVLNGLWLLNLALYAAIFIRFSSQSWIWDGLINLLNGLLLQVFLLIGYTSFFFLIERGLSLRILIEISRAPNQRLTQTEIVRIYPYDYILEKRLGQMFQMGYWIKKDGWYYSTSKGQRFAAIQKLVWQIFRIGKP